MSAVAALQSTAPAHEREVDGVQRFLLHGVPWESYVAIGEALPDWPIRMTYDRGALELMTTSLEHEEDLHLLALLLSTWCHQKKIKAKGYGRSTLRRQDRDRGMEPDACFYFGNLSRIRGKKCITLPGDPPPDLAIEIEVTRSVLDRLGILAAVGVSEVWAFDSETIRLYRLDANGRYRRNKQSLHLPGLDVQELVRFVKVGRAEDDTTMLEEFIQWIEDQD